MTATARHSQIFACTLPPNVYVGSKAVPATLHEIGHLYVEQMIRDTPGKELEWLALHRSVKWPNPAINFSEAAAESFRLYRTDERALISAAPEDDKRVKDFLRGLVGPNK